MKIEEYAKACEHELAMITEADVIADLNERVPRTVTALAQSLAAHGLDGQFASNPQDVLATAVFFVNAFLAKSGEMGNDIPEVRHLNSALYHAVRCYQKSQPFVLAARRVRERLGVEAEHFQ